jgi:ribulose-5-phosphate 4-epimerase/fuculose-1-phosphate aldolase
MPTSGEAMKKITRQQRSAFVTACHEAEHEYGLLRCSSGNMSWRIDAGRILVTGTRSWLGRLREDQVALVRLSDGARLNDCKPSVEAGFHAGILRVRPDRNVVLHFQTPFATTLACTDLSRMNFNVLPEVLYYIGPIAVLPYLTPGSKRLADAVTRAMTRHDLAMLRNHGQVVVGETFDDAFQKAVFFELVCEIIVRGGEKVRRLPRRAVAELDAGRRRNSGV